MKRLIQSIVGLSVAISLAGCCYSPGYVDSTSGVMYGGGYVPCGIPDPFALLFGCGGCHGGWGGGWGAYGVAPAASCGSSCGTAGCVGSYSGPAVTAPVINTYPHEAVPSVPAGIFEEAPPATPEAFTPAQSTGSIIYQSRPVSSHQHHPPTHDARNQRWVPARL